MERQSSIGRAGFVLVALLAGSVGPMGASDVWDDNASSDNAPTSTKNELAHGSEQWHDLDGLQGSTPDQDWYRISQRPYSSYEVVVDGLSGDVPHPGFQVALVDSDGTTVLQDAVAVGVGHNRSLRFSNSTGTAIDGQYIVVRGAMCLGKCGSDDVYRIRAFDTTATIARFNNTASQITVAILQNPTDYEITGTMSLWASSGTLTTSTAVVLGARQQTVLNLTAIVPGATGHITIAHDGRYGDLKGKATSLDPATGFSFDTALEHRPR